MYQIDVKLEFCYAHRLINHRGKCFNLHGHNAVAILSYEVDELDRNDFVVDFSDVKAKAKTFIDNQWDHAYLCNEGDALLPMVKKYGLKHYVFSNEPTAERIAEDLYHQLMDSKFYAKLVCVEIQETCTGSATYIP